MKKMPIVLSILFLILVSCKTLEDEKVNNKENKPPKNEETIQEQEDETEEVDHQLTVIAKNLEIPWSIEKIEDTFYISERIGRITKITNSDTQHQKVELSSELSDAEEAGLLGFILDPDFSENHSAFAYYTYDEAGIKNKVVKLQLKENTWQEQEILLNDIPGGDFHHGGRMKIGPDDKLYITTGDTLNSNLAQDTNSLAGKIIRMNLDGSVPSDNPFPDSYIYSYGHRNAQGLVWLDDDTLYASEHGNQANDEINKIEPGENYGWPIIEGTEESSEFQSPEFTSGKETTWAPSGMDAFENKLYVAGLRGNAVYAFDLDTKEINEFLTTYGRIRDVKIEDEFLYFITNNTDGRGEPDKDDDQFYRIHLSELD